MMPIFNPKLFVDPAEIEYFENRVCASLEARNSYESTIVSKSSSNAIFLHVLELPKCHDAL